MSFRGWQLEINAFLTDELNKCVQEFFGTKGDLQYCPAKPTLVLISTSRNNSRNQNSEFLSSFLITENSNPFKTIGREPLRPMTHQQRLSCLSGR